MFRLQSKLLRRTSQNVNRLLERNPPIEDIHSIAEKGSKNVSDALKAPPKSFYQPTNDENQFEFDYLTSANFNKTSRMQYHYDFINVQLLSLVKVMIIYIPKFRDASVRYENPKAAQHATGLIKFNNLFVNALINKNPKTQILTLFNTSPTPYIEVHVDQKFSKKPIFIDCTDKTEIEILKHIQKVFGKTPAQRALEEQSAKPKTTLFGSATVMNLQGCERDCMCRAEGQMPCPNVAHPMVDLDKRVRGKFLRNITPQTDPYQLDIDWEKQQLTEDYVPDEDLGQDKNHLSRIGIKTGENNSEEDDDDDY